MTTERPFPPRAESADSVVRFPATNLRPAEIPLSDSPKPGTEEFRSSYFDLEPKIIDLDRMAQIAFILAQEVSSVNGDNELLLFAVAQFHGMAADLRKAYSAPFEKAGED